MLRNILVYGVIAGVIIAIPTFGLTVLLKDNPPEHYGLLIGYTTMLVALSAIFVAIKRQRDVDGGGVIRFWPALALGLGVSTLAGIFYCLAWEAALAVTGMDFGADYARQLIEAEKAKGVSGAALAKFTAEMETFKLQYANPLYRLPMTFTEIFPVGVLVSLVSAALLRNSRFLPARAVAGQ
ncbi:DUF4199 domain-containing protein [Sphingomonas sp. 28-62-11]|uniref:DUF4199 domain-containing protein n=1 Tax=Sphingomonas sp. 28-62-11 TaxID=1970432 RepID=UPI000BDA714C|nr:MAG: DUF4199 domain-containing protein [Sphingomonas sp. 28-62-11]